MDCKEFREVLDLYVDEELSQEAMASAGVHLGECGACRRTTDNLLRLRRAVREAVGPDQPPPGLVNRVRRIASPSGRRIEFAALVATVLLLVSLVALNRLPRVRASLATGMESFAFHLDRPQTLVVEGAIVCRECDLFALYGSPEERDVQGHHGALKTSEGKIWTFMEGEKARALIHDPAMIGKRVRVRARLYRRAGCLEVESYEVLQTT